MGFFDRLSEGFGGPDNLLAASNALLQAGAPSRTPVGFGQALGMAGQSVVDAKKRQQEDAMKKMLLDLQLQQHQLQAKRANREMANEDAFAALAKQFQLPGAPAVMSPTEADVNVDPSLMQPKPGGFDRAGFAKAYEGIDPIKGLAYAQSLAKEKPKRTVVSPGSYLVDEGTGQEIFKAPDKPEKKDINAMIIEGPNGPMLNPLYMRGRKEIGAASASRNSQTVINAGPKEFEKELGQLDARQLVKYRDNAETAQSLLGTVANLRQAEQMGAYSGGGADTRLAVSGMVEGWTGIAPKGLVGSQIYNAEANKLILDRVKALGANPSNADREFIQKTVPQLATSAEARRQMIDWMERTAVKSIGLYQQADAYARKNSGLGGFNVITPAATQSGLPDASAIDAEIARRKAAKK